MKRQWTIGIMLTTWLVGLFLVLLFPPNIHRSSDSDNKAFFQPAGGQISGSFSLPDESSFEFEWKLSIQAVNFKWVSNPELVLAWTKFLTEYCSTPLFDVKTTFFYFFHTW